MDYVKSNTTSKGTRVFTEESFTLKNTDASIVTVRNTSELEAAVAAQVANQVIEVLAGSYTLTESLSIPLAATGGTLRANGKVSIVGDADADEAILINPAVATATFEYTLEGFDSIKGGEDKIGLNIKNVNVDKKVNVYLKQCNLHDNGTGKALTAVNTDGANAIRIYADGGQMSEIDGIAYTPKDDGDRVIFRGYNIDEDIVVADVDCTATFMFRGCKLPHEGVTGGHASNVVSTVNCWTEATAFVPVAVDSNDFPGDFSATIL